MSAGSAPRPSLHPPTRDATTLKNVLYGPGHEKFPSWPMAAAAEAPRATRAPPTGGSQRSKSWTDHTTYPKESAPAYSRPYMRRSNSAYPSQLKTVLENCEKNQAENYEYRHKSDQVGSLGARSDIPSPPERDMDHKSNQAFKMSYDEQALLRESYKVLTNDSTPQLTQADLEEYTRNYEETSVQHQKQPSYAQSEGYHSYVSSTDSTSTPFLDRLRRDIDTTTVRGVNTWDRDSVVTTSSGSASSSETLKWHGSLSDVSVASSSFNPGRQQLIAHSARVQTPQRHNSESVLYIGPTGETNESHQRKLYPIQTYTVHQSAEPQKANSQNNHSPPSPQRSVAERVHQYEKQTTKYTYLDPDKKTKVSDPALKAIQKKALLLFYERHQGHKSSWRSEPQLSSRIPLSKQQNTFELSDYRQTNYMDQSNENIQTEAENLRNSQNNKMQKVESPGPTNQVQSAYHMNYRQQAVNQQEVDDSLSENRMPAVISHYMENNNINNLNDPDSPFSNNVTKGPDAKCESYNTNLHGFNDLNSRHSFRSSHIKQKSLYDLPEYRQNSADFINKSESSNTLETKAVGVIPPNNNESHNSALQGPVILGPAILLDEWVPERPPKNQQLLRTAFPDLYPQTIRPPSPELPLPSPPLSSYEDEALCTSDEPFPPPPLEIVDEWKYQQEVLDIHPSSDLQKASRKSESHLSHRHIQGDSSYKQDSNNINNPKKIKSNNNTQSTTKPKLLKREYPSNHSRNSESSLRNSFANAHNTSRDTPIHNVNFRASVRESSHNKSLPQKPIISAQRQLYRSITTDESVSVPKKPINPFLRSTSMRLDNDHKSDGIFASQRSIQSDIASLQYHCAQKLTTSGKVAVATSEKVNKVSGQYRAEPLCGLPSQTDPYSNAKNSIWSRHSPHKICSTLTPPKSSTEHEKSLNKLEKNRHSNPSSPLNTSYSFCESNVENIPARIADVRSTNLENTHSQVKWGNPDNVPPPPVKPRYSGSTRYQPPHTSTTVRRQPNSFSVLGDQSNAEISKRENYKIINRPIRTVSSENNIKNLYLQNAPNSASVLNNEQTKYELTNNPKCFKRQSSLDILITENSNSLLVECPAEPQIEDGKNIDDAHNITPDDIPPESTSNLSCDNSVDSLTQNTVEIETPAPAVVEDSQNTEVIMLEDSTTPATNLQESPSGAKKLVPCPSTPNDLKPNKMIRLSLEKSLPEETKWADMLSELYNMLPADDLLKKLLDQYREYHFSWKNEIKKFFEIDGELNLSSDNLSEKSKLLSIETDPTDPERNFSAVKQDALFCLENVLSALKREVKNLETQTTSNQIKGEEVLKSLSSADEVSGDLDTLSKLTALISTLNKRSLFLNANVSNAHSEEYRSEQLTRLAYVKNQIEEAKELQTHFDQSRLTLIHLMSKEISTKLMDQYEIFIATKIKLILQIKDVMYKTDLLENILKQLSLRKDLGSY